MADYITEEQAKALQDQYDQAKAEADRLNQQYQDSMNGNTQTTTTGNPTQSEMDAMKELYPNLQYPSDYNTTSTTQTPTTTTANNDPWSWNNTPTTTTTSTNNQQTTGGMTPEQALAEFTEISNRRIAGTATEADIARAQYLLDIINGNTQPTTDTTQPPSPTNTTTTTTPTNPTTDQTSGMTPEQALAEFSQITSKDQISIADYVRLQELLKIINGNSTSTPGSVDGMTPDQALTEFSQITSKDQISIADYVRLQELLKIINGEGGNTNGTGIGIPGSNIPGSGVTHNYPAVDMDNRQRINDMYDAQINAQRAALQEQGDQALSDAQANRDKIASLYNKQRNAASVDWERQRRNFLEGANTSGLNTGAGSQAELSMMSMYQKAQNDFGAAQAQAEADADRNIADIKRSTQASINDAIAKNDYQKAAAMLDEYRAEYNRAMDRAEALAAYGDFSGYAALYGDEAAAQMRYTWIMSNPEVALAMGLISQSQYAALTLYKQYPALAIAGSSGNGNGDGAGYDPVSGLATAFSNNIDDIVNGIIARETSVVTKATDNG